MDAVILVGGGGTRLRPLTYAVPKPLIPVLNRPLIAHLLDNLRRHGVQRVVLAASAADRKLEEALGNGSSLGLEISYCYETEPLGSGVAVKQAARSFKSAFGGERFGALRAKGARVQRPVWASTSTKNPAYSDVLYIDNLIGRDTVNTIPPATLTAFMEHGQARATLEQDVADAHHTMKALAAAGINMEAVTTKLLADGIKAFADSYDQLLAKVDEKKTRLLAIGHEHRASTTGTR